MSWDGVNLTDLNGYMKNIQTGRIVPSLYTWGTLHEHLKANLQTEGFDGDLAEILIQTGFPFTGSAFGENVDIPYPQDVSFVKQYIPLKQIIVNAGITQQALQRASGGGASWGRAVDLVLANQRSEFLWLRELLSIGDGTGRLARVVSSSHSGGYITVTCDNTYADFGWENVALIKPGMWVECFDSAGLQVLDGANGAVDTYGSKFKVTAVSFGNRNNGAATTGTVTLACTTDLDSGTDATRCFDDGAILYIAGTRSNSGSTPDGAGTYSYGASGTKCYEATNIQSTVDVPVSVPLGLTGLFANAVTHPYYDAGAGCNLDTFQGLTRSSYDTLNTTVYQGDDYGGSAGTPTDWDLSVISDAINVVNKNTGGNVNLLLCSSELAMAIMRRNRSEAGIVVQTGSTGNLNQNAVGSQFASTFLAPDGRPIPIKVSATIPRNCLYGITTDDLRWYVKGGFDFLRLDGDVWSKSFADRKANFEAPFGGYENIGAERCDRAFVMQDLADNI